MCTTSTYDTDLALKIIIYIKEDVCDIFQKKGEKKNVVELTTVEL